MVRPLSASSNQAVLLTALCYQFTDEAKQGLQSGLCSWMLYVNLSVVGRAPLKGNPQSTTSPTGIDIGRGSPQELGPPYTMVPRVLLARLDHLQHQSP